MSIVFNTESLWKQGVPEPPVNHETISYTFTNHTPDGSVGIRCDAQGSGGNESSLAYTLDLSNTNTLVVYTRKDNHGTRDLIIRIDGELVYNNGAFHGWTRREFDVSHLHGDIVVNLGVISSAGAITWTAGFALLEYEDPVYEFKPQGTWQSQPFPLDTITSLESSKIGWGQNLSAGTTAVVSTAITDIGVAPTDWVEQSYNAEPQPISSLVPEEDYSTKEFHVRVELTTTDTEVTPEISGLTFEIINAIERDKVLLTFGAGDTFDNVEGPLTVEYSEGDGNLQGVGGPVASFSESFLPTDLYPFFSPYIPEKLDFSLEALVLDLKALTFHSIGGPYIIDDSRYRGEQVMKDGIEDHLSFSFESLSLELKHVDDIDT